LGSAGLNEINFRLGVDRCIHQLLLEVDQPAKQIDILPLGCDAVLPEADLGPQEELLADGLHVLVWAHSKASTGSRSTS